MSGHNVDMRLLSAGLHAGVVHGDGPRPESEPITVKDFGWAWDPHAVVVTASWEYVKEAEDHPMLGTTAVLVKPDGSRHQVATQLGGGWSMQTTGSAQIQALELMDKGRYVVEIRPAMPASDLGEQTSTTAPSADRILATLPLDVT